MHLYLASHGSICYDPRGISKRRIACSVTCQSAQPASAKCTPSIRTSRRRSITPYGSYSTPSIVYTDWRNCLCSNEYGFRVSALSPPSPYSLPTSIPSDRPIPPPFSSTSRSRYHFWPLAAMPAVRATHHRGKAHSRGKYHPKQEPFSLSIRGVSCWTRVRISICTGMSKKLKYRLRDPAL